jgi:hypothetical protein
MKILCTILFLFFVVDSSAQPVTATIFSTKKIWEQAPHNAFTDLIRFQGKFYCVFREGDRHVEGEGKLRVLTSTDGARWESAALLEEKGRDLRDAKISITPDGRLMLNGGSADPIDHSPTGSFHSVVSFSRDGRNWTPIQQINFANPKENRNWLWRVVWNKGTAYGVAYQADPASPANQRQFYAFVVKSRDGINFARISEDFAEGTEAALSFDKNDVLTILLRGRSNRTKAFVVQAPAPYKSWTKREITADCCFLTISRCRTAFCWEPEGGFKPSPARNSARDYSCWMSTTRRSRICCFFPAAATPAIPVWSGIKINCG